MYSTKRLQQRPQQQQQHNVSLRTRPHRPIVCSLGVRVLWVGSTKPGGVVLSFLSCVVDCVGGVWSSVCVCVLVVSDALHESCTSLPPYLHASVCHLLASGIAMAQSTSLVGCGAVSGAVRCGCVCSALHSNNKNNMGIRLCIHPAADSPTPPLSSARSASAVADCTRTIAININRNCCLTTTTTESTTESSTTTATVNEHLLE